ncbi:hypothetical protein B0H16DRAFT_1475713 [Mycena metata]|uniref:Uncharacterized protein n=1 Tax=Mycena metata TaxID=1033252 RepID=A0AAD7MHV6_9AGAR|nr:hypothetical protein B0H16DRAFT_1475713 [Mycena metata]
MVRFDEAQTKASLVSLLFLPLPALSTPAVGLFSNLAHFRKSLFPHSIYALPALCLKPSSRGLCIRVQGRISLHTPPTLIENDVWAHSSYPTWAVADHRPSITTCRALKARLIVIRQLQLSSKFRFVLVLRAPSCDTQSLQCLQTTAPCSTSFRKTRRLLHRYDYLKPYLKPSNVVNALKYVVLNACLHSSQDPHLGIKPSKSAVGRTEILPQVPRSSRFKPCRSQSAIVHSWDFKNEDRIEVGHSDHAARECEEDRLQREKETEKETENCKRH